jgi:signal transduction histidine kinase
VRIRFLHTESFRLAALYTAVFVVCVTALGASIPAVVDAAMRELIVQHSQADIAAINEGNVHEGPHEAVEVSAQLMAAVGHTDFLLLQKNGRVLAGNLPAMANRTGSFEIPNPAVPGHNILGAGARLANGLYAFSGSDLVFVTVVRARIVHLLLWLFAGAIFVAALGGLFVSRSFVARMDAIAGTCRAIMAGNLRDRIPVRNDQNELDRLAATINAMLDRIAALMDNLRQVSSDVAHDLRAPLTHLRQRLERARAESQSPEDYAAALDGAIAAADQMLSLFAALLRIAQIEGGARRAGFKTVDLAPVLNKLREVYGAVAEDTGHRLRVAEAMPSPVQGDPELLFQLLANLVENAIVHTPAGTAITVSLHHEAERAVLIVADDGPGIPPGAQEKIFRRFYRLDASRSTSGHGLGLALVVAVAELHGGDAAVATPAGTQGLRIVVSLPR